jgi:hypothetical protein
VCQLGAITGLKSVEGVGESKIADFDLKVARRAVAQEILGLEVAVDDIVGVGEPKGIEYYQQEVSKGRPVTRHLMTPDRTGVGVLHN